MLENFLTGTPEAMFKGFVVAVLAQFSALSFFSIAGPTQFTVLHTLQTAFVSAHYWWGVASLLGAATLLFEPVLSTQRGMLLCGYTAAICSFAVLSFDFLLSRPPIYAGGVLSVTTIIFLGGLLYERVRRPVGG
jgi:hypothetical protein